MTTTTLALPALHASQRSVKASPARFKVVCAGRRWGKTRFGIGECIETAAAGGRAWWIAPTYNISLEGWRPLQHVAHQIPGCDLSLSTRTVLFPGGGSISIRSSDRPYRLRGAGLDLAILDEAAYQDEKTWSYAIRPALADRLGRAIIISTPNGYDSYFFDLFEKAATPEMPDWERWQLPTSSNPYIAASEIAAARLELGEHQFAQEFLAQFVDSATQRLKPAWNRYAETVVVPWTELGDEDDSEEDVTFYSLRGELIDSRSLTKEMFVDLAASQKQTADFTVLTTVGYTQENPRRMIVLNVLRERMQGPDIIPAIESQKTRHGATVINIESAGFQLALVQSARRAGLPVKELRADRDKVSRALPLEASLEAEMVWLLKGAEYLTELEPEMAAFPLGKHDDQVDTLAYAAAKLGLSQEWQAW